MELLLQKGSSRACQAQKLQSLFLPENFHVRLGHDGPLAVGGVATVVRKS